MDIKELREMAHLTQSDVEDLTGIPARSIGNWENGLRKCPEYVETYLKEKLKQEIDILQVVVTEECVRTFIKNDNGEMELNSNFPVVNGRVSVDLLISLGRFTNAGYKIIYI